MVSLHADRRLAGVVLVFAAAVLALAGSARTSTGAHARAGRVLRGTNGPDVLRGTARNDILEGLDGNDRLYGGAGADRLYGGGGNDYLFGGPGDDKLMGGPGIDHFSCGPGHDVVYTNAAGIVGRDCEVVHRSGSPGVGGGGGGVASGAYHGDMVSFDVSSDAKSISNLKIDFAGGCPPASNAHIQVADSGPFGVRSDHTFAVDGKSNGGVSITVHGTLENGGVAHGTFDLHADVAGVTCDTGSVDWRAQH